MTSEGMRTPVGSGELVAGGREKGTLRRVTNIEDVLSLVRSGNAKDTVIYTEMGSVTNIAPLIADVRAVLCTVGGPTSHIAIVSRAFGRTCIVGVVMLVDVGEIEGRVVVVEEDGSIHVIES